MKRNGSNDMKANTLKKECEKSKNLQKRSRISVCVWVLLSLKNRKTKAMRNKLKRSLLWLMKTIEQASKKSGSKQSEEVKEEI